MLFQNSNIWHKANEHSISTNSILLQLVAWHQLIVPSITVKLLDLIYLLLTLSAHASADGIIQKLIAVSSTLLQRPAARDLILAVLHRT
jgi:hypothetical protein